MKNPGLFIAIGAGQAAIIAALVWMINWGAPMGYPNWLRMSVSASLVALVCFQLGFQYIRATEDLHGEKRSIGGIAAAVDQLRASVRTWQARPVLAPGTLAETIVRWLPFSKRGKAEVFGQLIADMREDYIEATAAKRKWRARAVVLHGYVAFALTLVVYLGSATTKRIVEIWKLV